MHNALLIHAGAVGDFVMSLRIVAAMREAGVTTVTVLGKPEIAAIAIPGGGVDRVIDVNQGGYHRLFSSESSLPSAVLDALRGFDLAVDMLGGPGSKLVEKLRQAGIPKVIAIDPRPRPAWSGHISDQWLDDLRMAGIEAHPESPSIRISADLRIEGRDRLLEAAGASGARMAILHPGSGSRQKCWPPADFVAMANVLRARAWCVVFLLGPVEMERFTHDEISLFRATAPTITDRSLHEALQLIAAADLFIGNDSGMSHLAAALGTPSVVIFGPTDPGLWGPLGAHVAHIGPSPRGEWPTAADVEQNVAEFT